MQFVAQFVAQISAQFGAQIGVQLDRYGIGFNKQLDPLLENLKILLEMSSIGISLLRNCSGKNNLIVVLKIIKLECL